VGLLLIVIISFHVLLGNFKTKWKYANLSSVLDLAKFWGMSNTIPCLTGHADYPNFTKKEKRYIDDPEWIDSRAPAKLKQNPPSILAWNVKVNGEFPI